MQLSFIYFATIFAAAWASPVPDSTNHAVTSQSLAERAVPYYQDSSFGDSGGDAFSDLPTLNGLKVAPTITKFNVHSGDKLNKITLAGFVGRRNVAYHSVHGQNVHSRHEWDVSLRLDHEEWLSSLELESAGVGLVYIKATTNLGNWVEAGKSNATLVHHVFTAPEGYTQVVGFYGTAGGGAIYRLGPIWA